MSSPKKRKVLSFAMAALVLAGLAVAGFYCRTGPTPDQPSAAIGPDTAHMPAIRELLSAWDGIHSVSAEVKSYLPQAIGTEGWTKGNGEYDLLKTEEGPWIRFQIINSLKIMTGDPDQSYWLTWEKLEWVVKGSIMYHYLVQSELKEATKRYYDPEEVLQIGGEYLFKQLQRDFDLTILPDEIVEGRNCTVLKGTPKNGDWTSYHYFDKATGIRVKMLEKEASGEESLSFTLPEFDVNPEFPPGHFTLDVAAGVEIVDKTQEGA